MVSEAEPESDSRRIGIFGGTFDPPHVGHVSVVSDVADALDLERVLWIPAALPPHKADTRLAPAEARLEMVRAAADEDDRFEVSTVELERGGPSYTLDTVRELSERWPDAEFFLIVGVDQFREFGSWREPEEIVRYAKLAVMERGGESGRAVRPDTPDVAGVVFVPVRRVDVSSTMVRARVRRGLDVSAMVPPSVCEVIRRLRLYRG